MLDVLELSEKDETVCRLPLAAMHCTSGCSSGGRPLLLFFDGEVSLPPGRRRLRACWICACVCVCVLFFFGLFGVVAFF